MRIDGNKLRLLVYGEEAVVDSIDIQSDAEALQHTTGLSPSRSRSLHELVIRARITGACHDSIVQAWQQSFEEDTTATLDVKAGRAATAREAELKKKNQRLEAEIANLRRQLAKRVLFEAPALEELDAFSKDEDGS